MRKTSWCFLAIAFDFILGPDGFGAHTQHLVYTVVTSSMPGLSLGEIILIHQIHYPSTSVN